jgi:hypothetical protein
VLAPQQAVVTPDFAALLPQATVKLFAAGRAAQAHHLASQQPGIALQAGRCCPAARYAGIQNGFLRQPFQQAAGLLAHLQLLAWLPTEAVIPFGRAGLVSSTWLPAARSISSVSCPRQPCRPGMHHNVLALAMTIDEVFTRNGPW